ncbi:MAG: hypothetical protein EXR72_12995 [Myxococcales bacterium]|nr:hypothetical protein [Myxococcales bacterium]
MRGCLVGGLLAGGFLAAGCKEEPTIVITFAPQDLAVAARPPDLARPVERPVDLAPPVDLAVAGDPCKNDSECALVKADCCGCSAGGKARGVARARVKAHDKELGAKCKEVACMAMMSTDPSCSATAACIAGRCGLAAKAK